MRKVLILLALFAVGCGSTVPPEPIIKYEKIYVDRYIYRCVDIPECGMHEEIPPFPRNGTDDEKALWAINVGEIRDKNQALDEGCIHALKLLLLEINSECQDGQ